MDFKFADIPVIDSHIHFAHPEMVDDVVDIMNKVPYAGINLVSTPNPLKLNENPAALIFKAQFPDRLFISGGLDYLQVFDKWDVPSFGEKRTDFKPPDPDQIDPERMSAILGSQIKTLNDMGFDGLKLIEGKPLIRKILPIPLDAPNYEGMWAALEELEMPVVFHVADPEEFWNRDTIPAWARHNEWFYGDGTFPTKEALYTEVDNVLMRHPNLKLILAHFYFLSADLPRAGKLFDTYPNVCFDLTPGSEMYANFTRQYDEAREFFVKYQDHIVYGTDIASWSIARSKSIEVPLAKAWVVRTFLETDQVFSVPKVIGHWMEEDLDGFHGIALPADVLAKIYHGNFERLYSKSPKTLNEKAVKAELQRMAASIDAIAGGSAEENQARQALELF